MLVGRLVAAVVLGVVVSALAAMGSGVGMPSERWSPPVIVGSIMDVIDADAAAMATADGAAVAYPHPAAPKTHVEPVYEQEPSPMERYWAPGGVAWRRYIAHPSDGTPFAPLYVGEVVPARHRAFVPRLPPTVMSPFVKPERVVGSHYPAIPDESCVCNFTVSDPRLCTLWVRAPEFECVARDPQDADACLKFAPTPVRHMCPCVHADNNRECYFWAPPGTRAVDYPQRAWPQPQPTQPQPQQPVQPPTTAPKTPSPVQPQPPRRPANQPKTPSNVRVPTVQPAAAKKAPVVGPQPKPPQFNPNMVVSPTKIDAPAKATGAASDVLAKAAAAMKAKVKAAKVAAVRRGMEKRVAAYREAAIKRYNAKRSASEKAAAQRRRARSEVKAAKRAAQSGFTPIPRKGARRLSLPSANRFTPATLKARVQLTPNGNARPMRRGMAVVATEYDKDVLTRTAYGEAQHDDAPGQVAVVWSLLNRARDPKDRFPKALADVCKQRGQFRTWANPKLTAEAQKIGTHSVAYRAMRRVVDDALAGRSADPTKGALFYYYNGRVAPAWAADMDCSFVSKVHTFCRPRVQRADIA